MLDQHHWRATREAAYTELQQQTQENVKTALILEFHQIVGEAEKRFELDSFAEIKGGNLRLQRDDKAEIPESVTRLQKVIDASMPSICIEQLLMEEEQYLVSVLHQASYLRKEELVALDSGKQTTVGSGGLFTGSNALQKRISRRS
ncbi:hypothetical protein FG465_004202 [Yersinia enterocolitica]|nr:hypothetical protein [Yersinia enterocolitica]HEI6739878.1 hypothetical protein [Yersinia enterocolitica]